jgi:hypothetical protein
MSMKAERLAAPRLRRGLCAAVVVLLSCVPAAKEPAMLLDLDGRPVDALSADPAARAVVFIFTSIDCPISNRYAPEVSRLHRTFESQGIRIRLVFSDPRETEARIRAHVAEFGYPMPALRDPSHRLVRRSGVRVTPEAAVYDASGALVYRGRIDDRYVSIGVERPSATTHDLEDAIVAVANDRPVARTHAQAVGCYIADAVTGGS